MRKLIGSILVTVAILGSGLGCTESDIVKTYEQAQSLIDTHGEDGYESLLQAAELLQEIESSSPNNKYTHTGLGRIAYKAGYLVNYEYSEDSLKTARAHFNKAIAIDPNFFDALYYGASAYLFSGDISRAIEMASKAEVLEPQSFKLDILFAHIARTTDKQNEVIEHCLDALTKKGINSKSVAEAEGLLSEAYAATDQNELADKYFNKRINSDPTKAFPRSSYSRFLINNLKDYDQAIDQANIALSLKDYGIAHKTLAYAYYKKGKKLMWTDKKYDQALEAFLHASHHNRSSSNMSYGLGSAYFVIGVRDMNIDQIKLAETHIQKALDIDQYNGPAIQQMTEVKRMLERYGEISGHRAK